MNIEQLTTFIFTHAVAVLQRETTTYPIANPSEGTPMNWILMMELEEGGKIVIHDETKTIWKREKI